MPDEEVENDASEPQGESRKHKRKLKRGYRKFGIDLQFMYDEDANLVVDFLTDDPEERCPLSNALKANPMTRGRAFTVLAQLLRLLKEHDQVHVLDLYRSELAGLLSSLREYGFKGKWLDHVAQLADQNCTSDYIKKLNDLQRYWESARDYAIEMIEEYKKKYEVAAERYEEFTRKKNEAIEAREKLKGKLKFS